MDVNTKDSTSQIGLQNGNLPECLESPFKWQLHEVNKVDSSDSIVERLLEKDEEIVHDTEFPWRSFVIRLVLCYESDRQGESEGTALVRIKDCESLLTQCEDSRDKFYKSISKALWHVTLASKAHLMLKSGFIMKVEQILMKLTPVDKLDKPNQAGILGIRAACLMDYGYLGCEEAMKYAKLAIDIDPDQAEWHFLYGKSMGTCRRVYSCFEILDDTEIRAMKDAVRISTMKSMKVIRYMVYLANVYREYSFRIYKANVTNKIYPHSNLAESVNTLLSQARDIYRNFARMKSDDPRLLTRCCLGLLKLPTNVLDCDVIEEGLERALSKIPNNAKVLHVIGMFFDRCKEDYNNALKYYNMSAMAGCYGAWHNLIKLKYNLLRGYDPKEDYTRLLDAFKSTPRRHVTLCQIGAYYLLQMRDPVKASEYLMQVFKENTDSYALKLMKPNFTFLDHPINIMKVLVEEVQYLLRVKLDELDINYKKQLRFIILRVGSLKSELLSKDLVKQSSVECILATSNEVMERKHLKNKRKFSYMTTKLKKRADKKGNKKNMPNTNDEKKEHMPGSKRTHNKICKENSKKKMKHKKKRKQSESWKEKRELTLKKQTGLPVDVVDKIRACRLEKPKSVKFDSLPSLANIIRLDLFAGNLPKNKKELLWRTASLDTLPSWYKDKCSTDIDSDSSEMSCKSETGGNFKAFTKQFDRSMSLSSVDNDFKNPTRVDSSVRRKYHPVEMKSLTQQFDRSMSMSSVDSEYDYPQRRTRYETPRKSENVGMKGFVKQFDRSMSISSVDSDYEAPVRGNKQFSSAAKEQEWSQRTSLSWRTQQGENKAFTERHIKSRKSSISSVDSDYEAPVRGNKQFSSASKEQEWLQHTSSSWRTQQSENRAFTERHIKSRKSSISSVDSDYENPVRGNKQFSSAAKKQEWLQCTSLSLRPQQVENRAISNRSSNISNENSAYVNKSQEQFHGGKTLPRWKKANDDGTNERSEIRTQNHSRPASINSFQPKFLEYSKVNPPNNTSACGSGVDKCTNSCLKSVKKENVTSSKTQLVVRAPYGPDERRKGFTTRRYAI